MKVITLDAKKYNITLRFLDDLKTELEKLFDVSYRIYEDSFAHNTYIEPESSEDTDKADIMFMILHSNFIENDYD